MFLLRILVPNAIVELEWARISSISHNEHFSQATGMFKMETQIVPGIHFNVATYFNETIKV